MSNFGREHHEEQFCEIILNLGLWFRGGGGVWILRFLIWSSGSPHVQWSGTIYATLVEGIMGNIHVKLFFKFGPMVQEEMSFKDISYLELWQPLCSVEWNHLFNFGSRLLVEQFCEIILNLDL